MTTTSTSWTDAASPLPGQRLARQFIAACLLGALPFGAVNAQTDPVTPQPPSRPVSPTGTDDVSGEVRRLARQLAIQVERCQQLEDELSRQRQGSAQDDSERERLSAKLSETRSQLQQTSAQLETQRADYRRIEERFRAVEQDLADARQETYALGAERDRLKGELQAARQDLDDSQRRLTAATDERDSLERTLVESDTALAAKGASLDATVAERDQLSDRLSRVESELDQRSKALADVTAERDATRQKLQTTQSELASERQALAAMTGERDHLTRQLTGSEQRVSALDKLAADTRAELEGERAAVARLTAEVRRLDRRNTDLQGEVAGLRGDLQDASAEGDRLRSDMTALKATLPPELGGSASLRELQMAAAGIADQMRSMHRALRRQPQNSALRAEFERAARRLRERQLLIAGETGAIGLYRLRPEDTLAAVAARFLGNGNQWGRIYEANRHILPDPDRLIAGLTLVLP